jgi:protein subunit release factor A
MIKPDEIRVDCFYGKESKNGQVTFPQRCQFVKITHIQSGISVTKESRTQIIARNEAFEELEILVELWKGEGE